MFENEMINDYVPVREQVAHMLRRLIITRELTSGAKLNERTLSAQLHISTTPVKEALRILESEGLIYSIPRKGSFVSDFSLSHVKQIIYARAALEGTAAYFTVENMTEELVKELEAILGKSQKAMEEADIQKFSEYNSQFHQILRKNCNNEYINKMVEILRAMDRTSLDITLAKHKEEFAMSYQEHQEIMEAIRRRDASRVEHCVVSHIRRVANEALES